MCVRSISLTASYYQQFDADHDLDVPGEGYGGWQQAEVEIDLEHTAVVVMHAWDTGTRDAYPGWYRAVEYMPRAQAISREVFPPLLSAVREHDVKLFHVVGGGDYYRDYPGYQPCDAVGSPQSRQWSRSPPTRRLKELRQFRRERVFTGSHNAPDVARGFARLDFAPQARPVGTEGIAENAAQLFALCREGGINHLIYAGFAINWCLLMSPGGMLDMSRRGVMCSAFRQAVTAVENRETARSELGKQLALWRVSLAFGFVFDVDDFVLKIGS